MNVTKAEHDYLTDIYTGRKKDYNGNYTKSVLSPKHVDDTDKIYVFPNCTIKKLPLRKWIKSINAKQVFKPEDATCLIVKNMICSSEGYSSAPMQITELYPISNGDYFNPYDTSKQEPRRVNGLNGEIKLNKSNMIRFCYDITSSRAARGCWNMDDDDYKLAEREMSKYNSIYEVLFSVKSIGENHLESLKNENVKLVNELDLQQYVHDWEVANSVRDDLSTFEWDSLYDLLSSENDWNIAIMMIKKGNVESMFTKLIACFYDENLCRDVKVALYNKVFVRMPDLRNIIDRDDATRRHYSWRRNENLSVFISKLSTINFNLDKKVFADMLNINIRIDENGHYNVTNR